MRRLSADLYATPGELARHIDSSTVETPALQLIDEHLVAVNEGDIDRLAIYMPPQEGKSMRVSRTFALWNLLQNPEERLGIVSYELNTARRWGRLVRNLIRAYPDLGLTLAEDQAAAGEWELGDGRRGGIYTAGIGGALTGRPIDKMIIDDPVKGRAEADSETERENAWDWWLETGRTRLPPGGAVILVMTRWHEDDLGGRLESRERGRWTVLNIPAQSEHGLKDREGRVIEDALGRPLGRFMTSARGRRPAEWEETKRALGSRGWNALYQGRPSPGEGNILKRAWWQWAEINRVITRPDGTKLAPGMQTVIISVDATFKGGKDSDYVVMQVWGRRGARCFLLDQVRDRMDYPETKRRLTQLVAQWPQASAKLIEEKANGAAILSELRAQIPGLIPVNPEESKEARANAVSAFIEAGNVELPDPRHAPWIGQFVEECAAFPNGAHDDQVDAATQALRRLLLDGGLRSFMSQIGRVPDGTANGLPPGELPGQLGRPE